MKLTPGKKKIIALIACSISLQYASTTQIIYTSNLFSLHGVDNASLSFLWLIGPLAGLCTSASNRLFK
jgi:hypothetical protein